MNAISSQYMANWHDGFVNYIGTLLGVVAGLMARPEASEEERLFTLRIPVLEG